MKNDKTRISANEINKFVYCPYQWYYERLYGRKELQQLYKERNELYNLKNTKDSNFKKGLRFHNNYLLRYTIKNIIKIIFLAVVFFLIGAVIWIKLK